METEGKKVMLEAFGTAAVKCALYNASGQELSGGSYARQNVAWTYDSQNVILNADKTDGIVAEFSVPAGTVKHVGFLKTTGEVMDKYDLGSGAETFSNPGVYQVTAASLELDPAS